MRVAFDRIHLGPPAPMRLMVWRPRRFGMGDTPGCGPASVQEALVNQVNEGAFTDPAAYGGGSLSAALASQAAELCQEAAGTAPFGCPPMLGCDPASIAAAAGTIAPQVKQTGPAYSPGFAPAPFTDWATPQVVSVAYSPPGSFIATAGQPAPQPPPPTFTPQFQSGTGPTAPPTPLGPGPPPTGGTPAAQPTPTGAGAGAGSGAAAPNWLTQTSIGSIPNWVLLASGTAVLLVVVPLLMRGGR